LVDIVNISLKLYNEQTLSTQEWIQIGSTTLVLLKMLASNVNVTITNRPITKHSSRK